MVTYPPWLLVVGMNFSLAEQRVLLLMLRKLTFTRITRYIIKLFHIVHKYKWRLPDDSMHKDGLVTYGFGIILPKDLKLSFDKRY